MISPTTSAFGKQYTTVYIQYKAHFQKGSFSEFKAKKKRKQQQQLWEPSRGQERKKKSSELQLVS